MGPFFPRIALGKALCLVLLPAVSIFAAPLDELRSVAQFSFVDLAALKSGQIVVERRAGRPFITIASQAGSPDEPADVTGNAEAPGASVGSARSNLPPALLLNPLQKQRCPKERRNRPEQ